MQKYPSILLENAVNEFANLPGIGKKTALRLALYLLRRDSEFTDSFTKALTEFRNDIKYCSVCHNICDDEICPICLDPLRDSAQIGRAHV